MFRSGCLRWWVAAAFAFILMFASSGMQAQQTRTREYNIKAVFLYNFTQFVEWPEEAFANNTAPFVVGILGEDPFRSVIDVTVAGEKVKEHPIIVRRYSNIKDLSTCHILFISETEAQKFLRSPAATKNKYMLTVSDAAGFANSGGMIRFVMQENKIKLQINPTVAKTAELNISSKLLRLADIVE